MKKLILGIMITLTMVAFAGALVPQYINYQGILRDSAGNLEDGTFSMVFKIYDAETAGTAVFNAAGSTTSVLVSNGLYSVRLGPVDSSIFDGSDRWLEVTVGSDTLSPRLRINSVAYAITADVAETATNANYAAVSGTATNAADADTVDGLSASSEANAGELLALDSNLQFKGMSVSAEAGSSPFALFINGRLGADAGTGTNPGTKVCGSASIPASTNVVTINNNAITSNSLILVTQGPYTAGNFDHGGVYVSAQSDGQFTVRVGDGTVTAGGQSLTIYYLIIN